MAERPSQIGRYQVKKTIGRGGMGTLFLAWDPDLDRDTAIKVLRDDDDELRERFSFEARSAAKLRHPHIVTIFDVGMHEGQPFIAMEYIHGETLAEIIAREAPLSTVRRLQLIEELCDALGFAHERGVIHRDVKPANLMVASDGVLKVLDFGIARLAGSTGRTQAGMLVGTPNYMSPEQILGHELDHRSDLFAVGALLYEMLTYRQAFPGNLQTGILHRILTLEPEPLLEHAIGIDPALADIVARALQKERDKRYDNLSDMRRELAAVRERLEVAAGKKGARRAPDSDRWARRRADEIDAHLVRAQAAVEAGNYDAASQFCEQALMLDSDDARINDLIERVRRVLDERQAEQWLDAAERHLEQGELTAAQAQLKRAAELTPTLTRLAQVRQVVDSAVEQAARERDEAKRRAESVAYAVERAESGLRKGELAAALAAAQSALTLQPTDPQALGLRHRVDAAIGDAVAAALVEARRRLAEGDERGAEDLLQQLQPASTARDEALGVLRQEIAHARSRLAACLADAERLATAGEIPAALATLQEFRPSHPSIDRALAALRDQQARLGETREVPAPRLEETLLREPGRSPKFPETETTRKHADHRGAGALDDREPDVHDGTQLIEPGIRRPFDARQTLPSPPARVPGSMARWRWAVGAGIVLAVGLTAGYLVMTSNPADEEVGANSAAIVAEAERLYVVNQRPEALALLERALAAAPQDSATREVGARWLAGARSQILDARQAATSNGATEQNSPDYVQAVLEDRAHVGFSEGGQLTRALASAWKAAELYGRARPADSTSPPTADTVAERRTRAQAMYAQNQPVEAMQILDAILEERPGDPATLDLRRGWSKAAALQLVTARQRAAAAGSTPANSPEFARAQVEEKNHAAMTQRRDDGAAILAARRAIELYARARPAPPAPTIAAAPPASSGRVGSQPMVDPVPAGGRAGLPAPPAPAPTVVAPPSAPPVAGTTAPASSAPPAPARPDEGAIRVQVWAVLDAFGRGYASRDVSALRAVWPAMTNAEASSYATLLGDYRSIEWTYTGRTMTLAPDGNSGDVMAEVTRTVQDKRGGRLREDISYRFSVRRQADRWEIARVVPGTIRRQPIR